MIVEFGADWCGPCGLMEKNITDLQKCMEDVIILHSDVVKDPKSADEYEIDTVPTFKFVFHNETINDTVRGMYIVHMISNIIIIYYIYQFGCRILKIVDPKEQNLWPRIYILKGNYIQKIF